MRLVLFAFFVVPAVAAQTTPAPGSLAAYQSARLYIEGVETVVTDGGAQVLSTNRTWQALRGDRPISEAEFYGLVGRDDLQAAADRRRKNRNMAFFAGGTLTVLGLGAMVIGGIQEFEADGVRADDPSFTPNAGLIPFIGGAVGITVGTGLLIGAGTSVKRRETHVQAAAEMAAVYNAQLDRDAVEAAEDEIRDTQPLP